MVLQRLPACTRTGTEHLQLSTNSHQAANSSKTPELQGYAESSEALWRPAVHPSVDVAETSRGSQDLELPESA